MAESQHSEREHLNETRCRVDELFILAESLAASGGSGQNEEVKKCYVGVLELLQAHPGRFGREKARAMRDLGYLYANAGDTAQGQQMLEKACQHLERTAGKMHIATFYACMNLFDFHRLQEDKTAAKVLLQALLPRAKRIKSTSHNALKLFSRLGWACVDCNLIDEEVGFFERAYEGWREDNPDSATTLDAADALCRAMATDFQEVYVATKQIRPNDIQRIARILFRTPRVLSLDLKYLSYLCRSAGDEKNATVADRYGRWSDPLTCDGCQVEIKREDQAYFACRVCWKLDLCQDCYEPFLSGNVEVSPEIRRSCDTHDFLQLEKVTRSSSVDSVEKQEDALKSWLSELVCKYSQMTTIDFEPSESSTAPKLTVDEELVKDDFEEFSFETKYIGDKSDDQVTLAEYALLDADVKTCRQVWAFLRTPALLKRFFAGEGFQDGDIQSGILGSDPKNYSVAAISQQVEAIIKIASDHRSPPSMPSVQLTQQKASGHRQIYSNCPLPEGGRSIRVIEFLDGGTGRLEARFVKHDLSDTGALQFTALSYVWGKARSPADPWFIHVDGVKVPIGHNLFNHLSDIQSDKDTQLMWIDAVCIDQENDTEKSQQVALMADIYSRAYRVLIHLGDAVSYTRPFAEFINRLYRAKESFSDVIGRLHLDGDEVLRGYSDVCCRSWWNRVWVQQEHALASESPTFRIGPYQFPSAHLIRDLEMLHRQTVPKMVPFNEQKLLSFQHSLPLTVALDQLTHMRSVLYNRHRVLRQETTHGFAFPCGLLKDGSSVECTDARDRVYGLHVFLDPTAQRVFRPDYKLTKEQVFEKLAVWVLVIDGWQEVFAWYPHRLSPALPSWVPDFSRPVKGMHREKIFQHPNKPPSIPLAIHQGVLALEGYLFDVIEGTCALTDVDWIDVVGKVWWLDCMHSNIPTPVQRGPMPLTHKALKRLHIATSMFSWVDSSPIPFTNAPLALPLHHVEVHMAINMATEQAEQLIEAQEQKYAPEVKSLWWALGGSLASRIVRYVFQIPDESADLAGEGLQRRRLSIAWARIYQRLIALRILFLNAISETGDRRLSPLLGASLYDYPNLVASIRHLHLRSRPCALDSTPELVTVKSALANISESLLLPSDTMMADAALQFGQLPPQDFEMDYGALQEVLVDAEYEEEVNLRVQVTLRLAIEFRKRAARSLGTFQRPNHNPVADYLQYKRSQIDKMNDFITSNNTMGVASTEQEVLVRTANARVQEEIITLQAIRGPFEDGDEGMASVRAAYEEAFRGRTTFTTLYGAVGMGARGVQDIRKGDKLILLRNTHYPLVIREMPGTDERYHEIVGYAHVRGYDMDDFNALGKEDLPPMRVFRFR